jgi:hypothetical protein
MARLAVPWMLLHVQCRQCGARYFAVIDGPLLPAWPVAPRAGALWGAPLVHESRKK